MRVLFDIVNEPALVLAHAEEIVGLFDHFWFCLVIGTLAIHQLSFRIKPFTSEAIEPLIVTEVYIIPLLNFIKDQFDSFLMAWVSRPNEVVVGDIQFGPKGPEEVAHSIHIFACGLPCFLRGSNNFISMLIGPCEKVCL